jgi:hypothetical protein
MGSLEGSHHSHLVTRSKGVVIGRVTGRRRAYRSIARGVRLHQDCCDSHNESQGQSTHQRPALAAPPLAMGTLGPVFGSGRFAVRGHGQMLIGGPANAVAGDLTRRRGRIRDNCSNAACRQSSDLPRVDHRRQPEAPLPPVTAIVPRMPDRAALTGDLAGAPNAPGGTMSASPRFHLLAGTVACVSDGLRLPPA